MREKNLYSKFILFLFIAFFFINTTPSFAQTTTYSYMGPAFDMASCNAYFPGYTCRDGGVTGSITVGIPTDYTGNVGAANLIAYSMSGNGLGLSYGATDCLNSSSNFSFSLGVLVNWLYQITACNNSGQITSFAQGSPNYDSVGSYMTPYSAGMIVNQHGIWTNPKSFGKPCDHAGAAFCGDPMDISTGNHFEEIEDYSTIGQNKLSFKRYYNSASGTQTLAKSLGTHWRSNYDSYISILSSTAVNVERADGQIIPFWMSGSAWVTDSDINLKLAHIGSLWALTDGDDTVSTYTTSGSIALLSTIKLRNGYTQTLNYTTGVLTSVSDSYSRSLGFTYTGGMLTGVTTPDSLTVTFGYVTVSNMPLLTTVSYNTSPVSSQTYWYENVR